MKRLQRSLCLVLCLALVLSLLPAVAAAKGSLSFDDLLAVYTSGTCGEDLTWALDKAGTLTISGTGPIPDYDTEPDVPWYLKKSEVKKIVIESGVTAIGSYAFYDCPALTDVYYSGTQARWNTVPVGSHNEALLAAPMHFAEAQTGDMDADGLLTTNDAVYLLLHVMFDPADYPIADSVDLDVNRDGELNTNDAVYLLLHVMFGQKNYPL